LLSELVTALEQDGQHARAVAVLEEHESVMQRQWLPRFQYVYNALMAGNLEKARRASGGCPNRRTPHGSRRARRCGASWPVPALCVR
jgi:hypothetical protein